MIGGSAEGLPGKTAMIYFSIQPEKALVKIGFTDRDAKQRRYELEKQYRVGLVLVAVIPGGMDLEREIHDTFRILRYGKAFKSREFFHYTAEVRDFISRHTFKKTVVLDATASIDKDKRMEDVRLVADRCADGARIDHASIKIIEQGEVQGEGWGYYPSADPREQLEGVRRISYRPRWVNLKLEVEIEQGWLIAPVDPGTVKTLKRPVDE